MGKIIVNRVHSGYSKDEDISRVMRYVCSEKEKKHDKRVSYWGTRGLPKDLETAIFRLKRSQEYMGKDSGRRLNHIIVSFPESIQDERLVYIVAEQLADFLGHEYPLIYGVHLDTDHLHIHFAMNTINYRTGKKIHFSKTEFTEWKNKMITLAEDTLAEWGVSL